MLCLQAESMKTFYNTWLPDNYKTDLFIVVNEPNERLDHWNAHFEHISKEYTRFNVKVLYRDQFNTNWNQWIPSDKNPWAVGWETQQILKLAVADYISAPGYFLLDSQNFLVSAWGTLMFPIIDGRLPYRPAKFNMPMSIWDDYCKTLKLENIVPNEKTLNICTPLFFHTELVQSLLRTKQTLGEFSSWFKTASNIKSEFTLYHLWAEKNGGLEKYHYETPSWAGHFLRDNINFDLEFNKFIDQMRSIPHQSWVSINHRAWGDMTEDQYNLLKMKFKELKLYDSHFDKYRLDYVDIKI
jgi:hypothetical protein